MAETVRRGVRIIGLLLLAALAGSCASPALYRSRADFYAGRLQEADQALMTPEAARQNRVLLLMERGTVRQARRDFEASSQDFIEATEMIESLERFSVTQGATSMVINDTVQDFLGAPYERLMLHALTAINFLALERWNDAAVGARRLVAALEPERLGDFPDSPFFRYLAGLCFELIDDPSNAALQYEKAGELSPTLAVDPHTGRLTLKPDTNGLAMADVIAWPAVPADDGDELICFAFTGRGPGDEFWIPETGMADEPDYAEILVGTNSLGRTQRLDDIDRLARRTDEVLAARRAAKTAARLVVKDTVAQAAGGWSDSQGVEELVRLILIGLLEQPDLRRWETLPHRLHLARVPLPPGADVITLRFRRADGSLHSEHTLRGPLPRRRNRAFAFFRLLSTSRSESPR